MLGHAEIMSPISNEQIKHTQRLAAYNSDLGNKSDLSNYIDLMEKAAIAERANGCKLLNVGNSLQSQGLSFKDQKDQT